MLQRESYNHYRNVLHVPLDLNDNINNANVCVEWRKAKTDEFILSNKVDHDRDGNWLEVGYGCLIPGRSVGSLRLDGYIDVKVPPTKHSRREYTVNGNFKQVVVHGHLVCRSIYEPKLEGFQCSHRCNNGHKGCVASWHTGMEPKSVNEERRATQCWNIASCARCEGKLLTNKCVGHIDTQGIMWPACLRPVYVTGRVCYCDNSDNDLCGFF